MQKPRYNALARQFIWSVLAARGWTQSDLAKESGVARSEISMQLAGKQPMNTQHLLKYLKVLSHEERRQLWFTWLRDNADAEVVHDLLNVPGDGLGPDVTEWVLRLAPDDRRMLDWLVREMALGGEVAELFRLLIGRAGYRPKRRRGNGGGGALIACLVCFAFMAPAPGAHTRKLRRAALNLRGREGLAFAAAEAA